MPGEYATIRAAVIAAQHGDEVVLAPGQYTGTGNLDLWLSAKQIVVRGATGVPDDVQIIVPAGRHAFVLRHFESPTTVIRDLMIVGPADTSETGRGMWIERSSARIENVVFSNLAPSSTTGSAVEISAGGPVFVGCQFINCESVSVPGSSAVFVQAPAHPAFRFCSFAGNSAYSSRARLEEAGGALQVQGGSAYIEQCTFQNNRAYRGGAIASMAAELHVIDSVFEGNFTDLSVADDEASSAGSGGAIFAQEGYVWVSGTRFSANSCAAGAPGPISIEGGNGGDGGAVALYGAQVARIHACRFEQNSAGAAGASVGASPGAAGRGGALAALDHTQLTLSSSLFISNTSGAGAVGCGGCPAPQYSCGGDGAAIMAASDGEVAIENCTIVNNVNAGGPDGCHGVGALFATTGIVVRSCILWNNLQSGQVTSAAQFAGGAVPEHSDIQLWAGGGVGIIAAEPAFIGSVDGEYELSRGSPCVDSGSPDAWQLYFEEDLGGNPRLANADLTGPLRVDMGAYEVPRSPAMCRGDADCDGDVDFFDIDKFVARLGCPGIDFENCHSDCPWDSSDIDANGDVDFEDIDMFVARLGQPCR